MPPIVHFVKAPCVDAGARGWGLGLGVRDSKDGENGAARVAS